MKIIKKINSKIFREYDLRGVVPTDINEDVAYTLGKSFGSYIQNIGEKETIIGYDNRLSSLELNNALIKGILSAGIKVISLGLVTTPMYYCAKKLYNIKTGIMITASHNPKEYNGFKISFSHMGNAYGCLIRDFMDFTYKYEYIDGEGILINKDINSEYIEIVKNSIKLGKRKVKVVADTGNGTGSIIIKEILEALNLEYVIINGESDGRFPNHHPDPSVKENMVQLSNKVRELGYDIGIGIDGDADRIGIVDEEGNIIPTDILMLLIYRNINKNMRKRKALFDVKCSNSLIEGLKKINIEPFMYRTGSSYTNMMMQEEDLDFGGEYSGHLFFRDKYLGYDDGIYAGLRVIEMLSRKKYKKLSDFLTNIDKYYTTEEIKYSTTDDKKFEIVNNIKEYFKEYNLDIIDIDGVRANIDKGWILVRASNTGPNITVRCESDTEENLEKLKMLVDDLMKEYNK